MQPFWKVLQEASSRGRSVIGEFHILVLSLWLIRFCLDDIYLDLGVLEANFIEPAHDKQDFERTPLFIRLETKLRQIIIEYWYVSWDAQSEKKMPVFSILIKVISTAFLILAHASY